MIIGVNSYLSRRGEDKKITKQLIKHTDQQKIIIIQLQISQTINIKSNKCKYKEMNQFN